MSLSARAPHNIPDRGPTAVAVHWPQVGVAIVVVAARFYTRKRMRITGVDDWLMLVTLVLFTVFASLVTYESTLGGFRHLPDVPVSRITKVALVNYVMQEIALFSYVTGKASVGCLILRFLGPKTFWRRWIIWGVMILTLISNSINCILTLVQCDPPKALWDHSVKGKCWNPQIQEDFALFVAAENITADVVLALLPATIFWNLNMALRKKINLCILLGLGLLAAITGIVKTSYLNELTAHSDLTWETYTLVVWSGAEDFVIIICGSIPPLKPWWDHYILSQRTLSSKRSRSGHQPGSDSRNYNMKRRYPAQPSSISSQTSGLVSAPGNHNSKILVRSDVEVRSGNSNLV